MKQPKASRKMSSTREDLAKKLGTKKPDLMKGFRQARKAGRLEKVRDDEEGTGHFRVRTPAAAA